MVRPRQVSDSQILEAARACFVAHGPGCATSVIAERLGISQAALFKRFGTKEDLMYAALAPPEVPAWLDVVAHGPDDRDVREQLVEIAMMIHGFFLELIPAVSVLRAAGADLEAMLRRFDTPPPVHVTHAIAGWLERAAAAGRIRVTDAEAVALALIGGVHMRAFLHHLGGGDRPGSFQAYAERVVDAVWRGIAPVESR